MKREKAVDPRNGLPSWNQLAEIAGLSTTTVTQMVSGSRKTSAGTIRKVAKALKQDPSEISEWLELMRPVRKRYEAPDEADLLTDRQRKALTALIRAIVSDDQEAGSSDVALAAQKSLEEDGFTVEDPENLDVQTHEEAADPTTLEPPRR